MVKDHSIKQVTATCVDYAHDGRGIVKYLGKPVFVDGLFLNEEAIIEITYEKKDYCLGVIKKLITLSADRIKPLCPVATACGGCAFQALSYEAEIKFKIQKVQNALLRIGGIDKEIETIIKAKNISFYRNKMQMPLAYDKQGRIIAGFYKRKSHQVVAIDRCYIENAQNHLIVKTIKQLMKQYNLDVYDEKTNQGLIRHIMIKTSSNYQEIMVVIITARENFDQKQTFFSELKQLHPEITTIIQNVNREKTNVVLGPDEQVIYGKGYIQDKIANLTFNISSQSFYQVNSVQAEKLYMHILEQANFKGHEVVVDAYCGVGTIALIISKYVNKVYGVEVIKQAINDANSNAQQNNIKNVQFIHSDVIDFMNKVRKTKKTIDVIIVDPPRKGLDEKFIDNVVELKISKVIYVSCDPATLARDLKRFVSVYEIKNITLVDMFPRTYHVESIVLLELMK